jgi:hypothetical protein
MSYQCPCCKQEYNLYEGASNCVLNHYFDSKCTASIAGRICGLEFYAAVHHHIDRSHEFMGSIAGIAQPVEQGLRKSEVAGSTPVSSSNAFSESQRYKMGIIVHDVVQYKDLEAKICLTNINLEKLTNEYKAKKKELEDQLSSSERQLAIKKREIEKAETELRNSILTDVIVSGVCPEPEPTEVKQEEPEDIGRSE